MTANKQFEFCGRRVDQVTDDELIALMAKAEETIGKFLEYLNAGSCTEYNRLVALKKIRVAKNTLSICGELLTHRNYKAEFLREVKTYDQV